MESLFWLWLLPLLPLMGSAVAGTLHLLTLRARKTDPEAAGYGRLAGLVACGAMGATFIVALSGFLQLRAGGHDLVALESTVWNWIDTGSFDIQMSLVVDHLSAVMILIITGVGLLIHVYSTGYMKGDPGYGKFFSYLNLFVFAMLMLVLSSSLAGLFVGWEGVGLCSYLLIGFWYEKGWPAEAGQKAFVVNRIGDACFLLGAFLLIQVFGTLDLSDIANGVGAAVLGNETTLMWAALLLFGGCCGKSAQFPLFTWLPDAMAGPTPVSALIHAATMVTAGVYLIVRLNPLFAASEAVLLVIGIVGALTAFIGASSALQQNDIKKVLAYSTVSQLGFMFLALSCGAWGTAIFHLMTHAFFKGLLFLGSGSVIHGMHAEQDMRKMGGLRSHMPRTYWTFLAGAAALSGLPLMSGFFSKDEILAHTFGHGGVYDILWIVGIASAAMTAFYTWRMVALTFFGEERFDPAKVQPHESPNSMTIPLVVLAVLALAGGLFGLPHVLPFLPTQVLQHWLEPVTRTGTLLLHHGEAAQLPVLTEWILLGFGSVVALFFAHKGFHTYERGFEDDVAFGQRNPKLSRFLGDAWRIDRIYLERIVQPLKLVTFVTATFVDQLGFDGIVNGVALLARKVGGKLRRQTDGNLKNYALWMGTGAAALVLLWIAV